MEIQTGECVVTIVSDGIELEVIPTASKGVNVRFDYRKVEMYTDEDNGLLMFRKIADRKIPRCLDGHAGE